MTEEELFRLFQHLRKPIYWDPPPFPEKLGPEALQKFHDIQVKFNTKIAQLEQEKMAELTKVVNAKQVAGVHK